MTPPRTTRAQRLAMPLARDVVRDLAVENGGCIRPVQLRRTDLDTGQVEQVLVPCGHTLATGLPVLRRAGQDPARRPVPRRLAPGHRTRHHPRPARRHAADLGRAPGRRPADARPGRRRPAARHGRRAGRADRRAGRGNHPLRRPRQRPARPASPPSALDPAPPGHAGPAPAEGRPADGRQDLHRAGRHDLPAVHVRHPDLRQLRQGDRRRHAGRPGRLRLPARGPRRAALRRAVRPARCRTCAASSATTSSTSPPSNRSGAWPRTSTWPSAAPCPAPSCARYSPRPTTRSGGPPPTGAHDDAHLPVWHEPSGRYLDPATGEFLPTWDDALDAIGAEDEPLHVARFGPKFDAQGVLAGSRDSARCIGYLTKYLTKHVADCHQATTGAQRDHADRLADALRYEPCSPTCANWLRYGVQPKNAREGMRPGHCTGKAHRPRVPRLRRAPRPGLPQVVRQDPRRPPRRPQSLAPGHPRSFGNRPGPLHLGTRHPRRPRPHAARPAAPARRRRPAAMARRPRRGQAQSGRRARPEITRASLPGAA